MRLSLLEIKRADQVDVLPRIGRNLFDDLGGDVVSGGLLLCVHTREQQRVIIDDRVGDQARALVPDLLLGLRLDAELPGVDVGDRASKPVIGFTAIERFLNALP